MQDALHPRTITNWKLHSGILMFSEQDQLELYDVAIAGHFGWKKVKYAISQWYYWPTLEGDVKAYVRACPHCQLYKPTV